MHANVRVAPLAVDGHVKRGVLTKDLAQQLRDAVRNLVHDVAGTSKRSVNGARAVPSMVQNVLARWGRVGEVEKHGSCFDRHYAWVVKEGESGELGNVEAAFCIQDVAAKRHQRRKPRTEHLHTRMRRNVSRVGQDCTFFFLRARALSLCGGVMRRKSRVCVLPMTGVSAHDSGEVHCTEKPKGEIVRSAAASAFKALRTYAPACSGIWSGSDGFVGQESAENNCTFWFEFFDFT